MIPSYMRMTIFTISNLNTVLFKKWFTYHPTVKFQIIVSLLKELTASLSTNFFKQIVLIWVTHTYILTSFQKLNLITRANFL